MVYTSLISWCSLLLKNEAIVNYTHYSHLQDQILESNLLNFKPVGKIKEDKLDLLDNLFIEYL